LRAATTESAEKAFEMGRSPLEIALLALPV